MDATQDIYFHNICLSVYQAINKIRLVAYVLIYVDVEIYISNVYVLISVDVEIYISNVYAGWGNYESLISFFINLWSHIYKASVKLQTFCLANCCSGLFVHLAREQYITVKTVYSNFVQDYLFNNHNLFNVIFQHHF